MARSPDESNLLGELLDDLARTFADEEAHWSDFIDARTLRRFRRNLDESLEAVASSRRDQRVLDRARSIASELLVAERLLSGGCTVEHEAETPSGRRVDFVARREGAVLCVHVKRAPQPTLRDAQVTVPAAWRTLESVRRGVVVALALARNLRGRALNAALDEAFEFVEQASVGDELAFRDSEARLSARLRVIAPSTGGRVELVADLSQSFDDHVPRFQSTLRKAFAQFMPRTENLIVVCGSAGGVEAFATALLGSHIERWDKRPRAGELIAYGRGGDGFWAGSMRNQSRLAAYWTLAPGHGPLLFVREPTGNSTAGARLARSVFA
jgi:hypothetical protein